VVVFARDGGLQAGEKPFACVVDLPPAAAARDSLEAQIRAGQRFARARRERTGDVTALRARFERANAGLELLRARPKNAANAADGAEIVGLIT